MNRHAGEGLRANNKTICGERPRARRWRKLNIFWPWNFPHRGAVNSLPRRTPDVAMVTEIGFVALRCRQTDLILRCNNETLCCIELVIFYYGFCEIEIVLVNMRQRIQWVVILFIWYSYKYYPIR